MVKLTEARTLVLAYLARLKEFHAPPTGPEISTHLGHSAYWATPKLVWLEYNRLVERLGQSSTGGNCYRITPAGRAALADGGRDAG
ncbi:hypothetical protein [Aquamicrobium soli]|uniref:DUF3253 domain-containing protein n=1 Tax=Aquamicrobium soli TaxID=1811518 RepID=A0ABV7KIB5_9HYPH